jgi:hypothetical protein
MTLPKNSMMLELTAPIPQNRHSSLSPVDRLPSRRQANFEAAKFEALDAEIYCDHVFAAVGRPLDAWLAGR